MSKDIQTRYEQARQVWKCLDEAKNLNDSVFARWIGDSHTFWYKRDTRSGADWRLVDADARSNEPAFDHAVLGKALAAETGETLDPLKLPLNDVHFSLAPLSVRFNAFERHWEYQADSGALSEVNPVAQKRDEVDEDGDLFENLQKLSNDHRVVSPDGRKAAFARDHNLWLLDLETGDERALTTEGTSELSFGHDALFHGYTTVGWAPDSSRLVTLKVDMRNVTERLITSFAVPDYAQPHISRLRSAYPGDEHVEMQQLVVIDIDSGEMQMPAREPMPVIMPGVTVDYGYLGHKPFAWWSSDGQRVYFLEFERGGKRVSVIRYEVETGETSVVFNETSDRFVRLEHQMCDATLFRAIPETEELIWFSERDGWGHLYLYDLATGEMKKQITSGDWLVRDVIDYDPQRRELILHTAGRDPAKSPYYRDVCRVNIDSGSLTPLAEGNYEYVVYYPLHLNAVISWSRFANPTNDYVSSEPPRGASADGEYILVTRSRVDIAPVSILLDRDGNEILTVETAEFTGLPEDWVWPEPVKTMGADGETEIYGTIFRPPGFSADESYPVLVYANSNNRISAMAQGSFGNATMLGVYYKMAAAFAAVGFIVVTMEGRGLPLRNRAFLDHHDGDWRYMNDFDDRIAGLKQLAERYPQMDLDRLGLTGEENPSNNVYAALSYPEVFKAVVVNCLTDVRFQPAIINEPCGEDRAFIERSTFPEDEAASLGTKLFLIAGMRAQIPCSGTLRLVEALQKANKDFEMLMLPNLAHTVSNYSTRREWDFLVRHLQGIEPPKEFLLTSDSVYDLQ